MNAVAHIPAETAHQLRVFWRTKISAFFTVGFPMLFFLIFNLLQGNQLLEASGLRFAQFFTPSIAVFAMVTAGYTNIAIGVSIDRDEGILKRVRSTPLSPAAYMASRILASVTVGFVSVVLMAVIGVMFFDVTVIWDRMAAAMMILLFGAAAFAALGVAVAGAAPNAQAAPVVANITILPLLFISGIFFPLTGAPRWLEVLAGALPLKPLTDAFRQQWDPTRTYGFPWRECAILVAWLVIGLVASVRTFTWDPRPGGRSRGRSDRE